MKEFIYGTIIIVIVSLGFLLYGNLQDTARKQASQESFQERTERMLNRQTGRLQPSSPVWEALPASTQKNLTKIGFQPAKPADRNRFSFSLPSLSGQEVNFSSRQGQWLMLNFWATWCAPCRFEMPSLEQLHQTFKTQPFSVIGINLQEPRESIEPFVRRMELTFPIWLDREGTVANDFFVTGVPETWLIAPGNRPVARMTGSRDWNDDLVIKTVKQLLQSAREAPSPSNQ